jgi:DNA-binding transcriptional LysR family regulator
LLILQAVAAAGGVGAAARRLHLAPSGISQHLARLERETGLVLVDRSSSGGQRPLRLTAAGRRLAAHGARLADVLAEAEEDVYAMSERLSGTVDVGAFSSVITCLVLPALALLEQRAPGVQLRVHEASEAAALSALRGGELDLVVVEDPTPGLRPTRPGLEHRWLLDDPYRVVVPAGWPEPRSLHDLESRPWISGPVGTAAHVVLEQVRRSSGLALPTRHTCVEFPAVLALVEAGLGASLVPSLALPPDDRPGLRSIALPELGARQISAVLMTVRRRPPLITETLHAFVEATAASA